MLLSRLGRGGENRELFGKWKNNLLSAISPTWERCFSPQLTSWSLKEKSWSHPLAENLSFTCLPSPLFGVQCRALSQQSDLPWGWQAQLLVGSLVPTHPPSLLWARHRNPSPFSVLQQKNPPPNWWLWWKPVRFPTPYSNTTSHLFFPRSYTSHTPAPGPAFANLEIFLFLTVPQGTGNPLQHLTGLSNSPACSPRCISYKDECACSVSAQELQTQISVPQAKGVEPALTSPLWGGSLQLTERRRVQDPLASALPRASCSCSQWGQKESFVSLTKHPRDVAFSCFQWLPTQSFLSPSPASRSPPTGTKSLQLFSCTDQTPLPDSAWQRDVYLSFLPWVQCRKILLNINPLF